MIFWSAQQEKPCITFLYLFQLQNEICLYKCLTKEVQDEGKKQITLFINRINLFLLIMSCTVQ